MKECGCYLDCSCVCACHAMPSSRKVCGQRSSTTFFPGSQSQHAPIHPSFRRQSCYLQLLHSLRGLRCYLQFCAFMQKAMLRPAAFPVIQGNLALLPAAAVVCALLSPSVHMRMWPGSLRPCMRVVKPCVACQVCRQHVEVALQFPEDSCLRVCAAWT